MSDQFKEAIDRAGIMHAFGGGKTIESKSKQSTNWQEDHFPSWNWEEYDYRVKEEEKWRPWTAEEVPVGAQCRRKGYEHEGRELIVSTGETGIVMGRHIVMSFASIFEQGECSLDGGKTWQPCGVKVN